MKMVKDRLVEIKSGSRQMASAGAAAIQAPKQKYGGMMQKMEEYAHGREGMHSEM